MTEQARIETAVEATIDNCELFRAQIAEQAREIELLNAEITAYEEKIAAHFQPISDEREAFEVDTLDLFCTATFGRFPMSGSYNTEWVQERWEGWQARARLGNAVVLPEPIQVEAVAVTREDEGGALYLDWLLEGGIAALEVAGQTLLIAHGKITDDEGSGEVYSARPDQREGEVVPPELLLEAIDVLMLYTRGSASREGILINDLRALLNGGRS